MCHAKSPGTTPDRRCEAIGKNGAASPWHQGCQGHKPMLICAFTLFGQGLQCRAGSWGCWEHPISSGQPLPSRSGPFPCLPFLPGTTQPPTSHREEEHQEGTSWPPTRHRRSSICAILSNGWDERGPSLRWLPLLLLPQAPALSIHRPRSPAPSFSLFLSFILTLAEMPQHHPGSLVCGMVMLS